MRAGKGGQQDAKDLPAGKAAGVIFIRQIVQLVDRMLNFALHFAGQIACSVDITGYGCGRNPRPLGYVPHFYLLE